MFETIAYRDQLIDHLQRSVAFALEEDIGDGDVTAQLIPADQYSQAQIISRQPAIVCGIAWVNEVFTQLDARVQIDWQVEDGQRIEADQVLATLQGPTRALLTGERSALNFLQTLCATATQTQAYLQHLRDHCPHRTPAIRLLDTRKTLPGLRLAQKYATYIGGANNHRLGLFDQFLIKENHIRACGSIAAAIERARTLHPRLHIEIEVESYDELQQAIDAAADSIMLDNFKMDAASQALIQRHPQIQFEYSGNLSPPQFATLCQYPIDAISCGALTKHIQAIDLSMLFI